VAEVGAAVGALAVYRGTVLPPARRRIAFWRERAQAIPDPGLRTAALRSLDEKRGNVEATAVFATLAPRARRQAVIHGGTALQIAVDYLDLLSETSEAPDRLSDGLRLHRALLVALTPGAAVEDWYAEHGYSADGGYLDALVRECQAAVATLPSAGVALPPAREAAQRCGEGQSRAHAGGPGRLEAWARTLGAPTELRWYEAAAGASSSVAAHALVALAAGPRVDAGEAEGVARAYDPWIGALTVLLDDLVDADADAENAEHNYLDFYRTLPEAIGRVDLIASRAQDALTGLPRRHRAILAGVLSYYLGSRATRPGEPPVDLPRTSAAPSVRLLAAASRIL
jgi:tetraprenyl-beta-curcumene synthase